MAEPESIQDAVQCWMKQTMLLAMVNELEIFLGLLRRMTPTGSLLRARNHLQEAVTLLQGVQKFQLPPISSESCFTAGTQPAPENQNGPSGVLVCPQCLGKIPNPGEKDCINCSGEGYLFRFPDGQTWGIPKQVAESAAQARPELDLGVDTSPSKPRKLRTRCPRCENKGSIPAWPLSSTGPGCESPGDIACPFCSGEGTV